ncbi:hypothetical protein TNCV_1444361 [Trichonephila clavipes]|nr:hypothetical protein TNCV_1444361 [Trichonephila clavipes]
MPNQKSLSSVSTSNNYSQSHLMKALIPIGRGNGFSIESEPKRGSKDFEIYRRSMMFVQRRGSLSLPYETKESPVD